MQWVIISLRWIFLWWTILKKERRIRLLLILGRARAWFDGVRCLDFRLGALLTDGSELVLNYIIIIITRNTRLSNKWREAWYISVQIILEPPQKASTTSLKFSWSS
jgi:hypothetical protein